MYRHELTKWPARAMQDPASPTSAPNADDAFWQTYRSLLDGTGPAMPSNRTHRAVAHEWPEAITLAGRGALDNRPEVRELAAMLARNIAAREMSLLSEAVHDHGSAPRTPSGWTDISEDIGRLSRFGLDSRKLGHPLSGFGARMYEPDSTIFRHDLLPTMAFDRTDVPDLRDWRANVSQAINGPLGSSQYRHAVKIGTSMREQGLAGRVIFTGHSLGGGLAAAAGSASGALTYTFGAAGLHPQTVTRYGGTLQPARIFSYRVDGDPLIDMQRRHAFLPNDAGTPVVLPGEGAPRLRRHFMKQYWIGLNRVIGENLAALRRLLGDAPA
jgi:hypothetical protein